MANALPLLECTFYHKRQLLSDYNNIGLVVTQELTEASTDYTQQYSMHVTMLFRLPPTLKAAYKCT